VLTYVGTCTTSRFVIDCGGMDVRIRNTIRSGLPPLMGASVGPARAERDYEDEAISALQDTPEMAVAVRRRGLEDPVVMIGGHRFGAYYPDGPHLPATFRNVTVADILDAVAIPFRGIIVYAACPEGLYHIDFGVRDFTGQ
jgi:hypothetical protein